MVLWMELLGTKISSVRLTELFSRFNKICTLWFMADIHTGMIKLFITLKWRVLFQPLAKVNRQTSQYWQYKCKAEVSHKINCVVWWQVYFTVFKPRTYWSSDDGDCHRSKAPSETHSAQFKLSTVRFFLQCNIVESLMIKRSQLCCECYWCSWLE